MLSHARLAISLTGWATGELQWMHPEMEHGLVWDASMGIPGERMAALTKLLARSLNEPLLPALLKQVTWLLLYSNACHHQIHGRMLWTKEATALVA